MKELSYLRYHNKKAASAKISSLLEDKKIIPIRIQNDQSELYYTTKRKLKELDHANEPDRVHILSPFDNIVIQRKRLKTIFDFDYLVECYVPAPKRKYGYFCLPVVYGDKFAARLDAKADRAGDKLILINLHWEKEYPKTEMFRSMFQQKLSELAEFSGCKKVDISKHIKI
jgi:hypothetical protein